MRTDTGQVFRLEDYHPSDYLIARTDLTFRLSPQRTHVASSLAVTRRQGVEPGRPLILDGDGLKLLRVAIDGVELGDSDYQATPDQLIIPAPPRAAAFALTIETEIDPSANTALMGLYPPRRRLLHAMRGRRLPPHHLFPRPAGRPVGLHGAHRGAAGARRRCCCRTAISSTTGELAGRPALRRLARSLPQAVLSVRAGRRRPRLDPATSFVTGVGPHGRARHLCRARQGAAAPATRWTR